MIEQSVQSPFHLTRCKLIETEDPLIEAQKIYFPRVALHLKTLGCC